jgi:hypothetical protein
MNKGTLVMGGLVAAAVAAFALSSKGTSQATTSGKWKSLSDKQLMRAVMRGEAPSSAAESDAMIQRLEGDYSISKGTMPASKDDPAFLAYLDQRIGTNLVVLAGKDADDLHLLATEAKVAQDELAGNALLVDLLGEVERRSVERGG